MNAATDFDVGPLTWVKSEIDLALERADQALQQFTASAVPAAGADHDTVGSGDLTQIKFCRTHLHQVQGALTIVGLDGLTQFAETLESLLEAIEQQTLPSDSASIALAQRALAAIRHYLDDLINGQPNQPLRLMPLYRELQTARGQKRISETDLFFPDLSVRLPRRAVAIPAMDRNAFRKMLRQERARFQRGLLSWLRMPQDRSGIGEMLSAVKRIEATQDSAAARSFWWIASGFLAALADGTLPAETNVKQLCARIDLQIRRLFEGSKNVAERLMRDALYFVASADSNNDTVQQVKATYQLHSALPTVETTAPAPQEATRRRLREVIAATEEAWGKFCAGTVQALSSFKEHATTLAATVGQLGHPDYLRLAQAIAATANWLAEKPARHGEAVAMEIATAILLTQNAQENFHRLGRDFAHQVDVMVARLHGCVEGHPPLPGSEIPLLDEMSRQAQEKLLIGQVAKEIQNNLGQIEQVLDGFFRDADKRTDLAALDTPLRQVIGALTMMRHDGAVAALRACAADIKNFAQPEYVPQEADFERVADQLSLLGFFIDALPSGATDFDAFVRKMRGVSAEEVVDEEEPGTSVEQEVEQQKRDTHALLEALKEQPGDAGLREEIKQNLTALKDDADLVADKELGQQAKAVLSVLEAGGESAPQIDEAIATLKLQTPLAPPPSAATMQLSQASSEEIDAELLAIFLEEAAEVLGTIDEFLARLHEQAHNGEVLTTIRRSFHTLKGSGRMVGLKDLGEAAWAIEQVLNLWLRQELEVSTPIFDLLDEARAVFSAWVRHLENPRLDLPDPGHMMALAEALRRGDEETPSGAAGAAPQVTTAAVAASLEIPASDDALVSVVDAAVELPAAVPVDFGAAAEASAVLPDESETIELEALSEPLEELIDFEAPLPDVTELAVAQEDLPVAREEEAAPLAETAAPLSLSVSSTLYEIFLEEARNHLATLQREFGALETDASAPTTPREMYRAAHTLAGIAATVGLPPINRLGLALEHALLRREHAAQPGSLEALEIVRQTIAEIELMVSLVAEKHEPKPAAYLIEALDNLYPAPLAADEDLAVSAAPLPVAESPLPAEPEPAAASGFAAKTSAHLHDELDEQLLPIFLEEALDLNRNITTQLRAWRVNPADGDVARTLSRLLHTLKGSARMVGAMNLGEITHAIESRVEEAQRTGSAPLELIEEIDNAFDAITQVIDRLQHGEALDLPAAVPEPTELTEVAVEPVVAPPVAEPTVSPRTVADRRRDRRSADESDTETLAQHAMLRVRADLIDRLVNEAGELSIARARIEGEMRGLKESLLDLTENVIRLRRQLRDIEIQAESQMQSRTALTDEHHAGFDPLEFDRFTRFQELTRMMAESVNDVATVQQNLLKNLDDANAAILAQARLNREVQQELMSVRMVPFSSVADRLYRIVRQTAKELGKRANLEIHGGQVEIDRSVLDKIGAPLEHLLRNAVAHGLEERDVRVARGKPEIGEIALTLTQEGNEIILNFSDDGAGLDFDRIRARGVASGLIAGDDAGDSTHLVDLIFTPGFSTASELSQVAGRGIGMDVVKTEVSSLGGRIEVVSTPGQGTSFRLYIPLTLAVTQALLVRTGSRQYAIPSVMIEQVLDLKEAALTRIRESGAAEWMGNHYPFHFLPQLLGDTQALPEMRRKYWVLLLRSGSKRIAVQVDELKGNQEVVVKNIGPQLARVVGIDGATVLGNGQVVLILNPVALTRRAPTVAFAAPVPTLQVPAANEATSSLPTVMVVDDSLTVRKITGRLLAREGYQVITAKDGVDALEQLLDVVPDVMLVDIEMPRMDGFDLTRNIRADARLKGIPIIMITSRTADKHRHYAFEIGVNQYLGKPYQEEELLRFVADYVKQRRSV
jgi:chemosensory pili system protein ChpA (sensor histidine kinase/response regulator)